jgi:RAP domain
MDFERPNNGLSLPSNFPEGWIRNYQLGSPVKLNITTSKLEKSVTASLKRIGYYHVAEHTITMKEMADAFSINIPPKDIEVLSIDMANIDKKVAIEVDGPFHFIVCIDSDDSKVSKYNAMRTTVSEYKANGRTVLKRRLLTSMGWTVLTVPFWEWQAMRGDYGKEEDYCRTLLASVAKSSLQFESEQ